MDNTLARHHHWMGMALALALEAGLGGDVPVGAVVVDEENQVVGQGVNRRQRDGDPTAHAEILALRQAGLARGRWHLGDCILYVTLEPCPMCTGAILLSRLRLVVYGAADPKAGAVRSVLNLPDSPVSNHHLPVLGGILQEPCQALLQDWFRDRRG